MFLPRIEETKIKNQKSVKMFLIYYPEEWRYRIIFGVGKGNWGAKKLEAEKIIS